MILVTYGKKFTHPIVLALGFFDCMHKGHAALVAEAKRLAAEKNALPALFTFTNDMGEVLGKEPALCDFSFRRQRLDAMGIRVVVTATFDSAFASTPAHLFLKSIFDEYTVEGIVTGEDYRFGRGARGDLALLRKFCEENRAELRTVPDVCMGDGRISTTRIRAALKQGDIALANEMLGYPFSVTGAVSHGRGIGGSKLGFATANVVSPALYNLAPGVYATQCRVDGRVYRAVTNVGGQPTVGGEELRAESYLMDFSGDLYGKSLTVQFRKFLRPIRVFSSLEELQAQIAADVASVTGGEE